MAFIAKLDELGKDHLGVIVSSGGFQSGAKLIAGQRGIVLRSVSQLPTLAQMLLGRIMNAAIPSRADVGVPFWALAQQDDGELTGSWIGGKDADGRRCIPLYFSRKNAEIEASSYNDPEVVVVGLTQQVLRTVVMTAVCMQVRLVIGYPVYSSDSAAPQFNYRSALAQQVADEFYEGKIDLAGLPRHPLAARGSAV